MGTIDIRAKTYCSLGEVISGNFSDTYAQSSGLIFTRGSVELKGSIRPAVGTVVQFAYAKGGVLARLPRTLRVLSSFADPFRRTTKIELGCLLTLLENRKPPVKDPNSKEENDVPCYVYEKATLPISAKYVTEQILSTLGITADPVPLTNYFSVEEFDLSSGFIQVLSDLLVSEGYIGYLDEQEILRFRDLSEEVGSGPLVGGDKIIDIEPIGVGDLPGDAVIVRYSSLRLKPPDELENEEARARRAWEWEETFGLDQEVSISYENDDGETVTVIGTYRPYSFTASYYDVWDRPVERFSYSTSSVAETNNRWAVDLYKSQGSGFTDLTSSYISTIWNYKIKAPARNTPPGFPYIQSGSGTEGIKVYLGNFSLLATEAASECKYPKPDGYEEVLEELTESYISEAEVAGTLNVDSFAFETQFGATVPSFSTAAFPPGAFGVYTAPESRTIISYELDKVSGITKTSTRQFLMYGKTTSGQQDMATRVSRLATAESFDQYSTSMSNLIFDAWQPRNLGVEVRIRTEREFGLQRRPSQEERNNTYNSKPNVTDQVAEVTWVTGSTESTNYIEFNLPYAPDDRISWSESTGYTSTPSDAPAKALKFGRIQNRLLLGNRSGVSLQLPVELMPPYPFDPLYLKAEGLTAQYRVNGASFTFDSNGIVASADCLFWGGTGQEAA